MLVTFPLAVTRCLTKGILGRMGLFWLIVEGMEPNTEEKVAGSSPAAGRSVQLGHLKSRQNKKAE